MTTVEWRVRRVSDSATVSGVTDVKVVDTLNRFGRHAKAWIDDFDGTKWGDFRRGTALEFDVSTDGGSTFSRRFAGFVVERREADRGGADELEVEVYSYDHFLRRNNVTRSFTGQTISSILKEVVEDFTPVTWNASNVTVVNDDTIDRDFEGEKVDNLIRELAGKSANEEFGVNDDLEFFFRPRETTAAPRNIDNSQWLSYDIPEAGKEALNEVQLFYGESGSGNEGSVVVTDGADKLELQNEIGTAGPVVFREEVTREDIDNEADARDKAEEILHDRETTLTGDVTTFGLFDAEPGQVIDIAIEPRGLDGEFRIAELKYEWGRDETAVTIVEKRGATDEKLVRLTDTLKRVEQRAADRDVAATQFEGPLISQELLTVTATATTRTFGDARFNPGFGRDEPGFGRAEPGFHISSVDSVTQSETRATTSLLEAIRDGWRGATPPDIGTISVGDGTATVSRTDSSLANRLFEIDAPASAIGSARARFEGSRRAPQAFSLEELGVEAAAAGDTTLYARARMGTLSVDNNAPLDVRVTVEAADDATANGVITDTGATTTRDIIADNDPDAPTQFAFGTDNTTPTTGDTALGAELSTEAIDTREDRQLDTLDITGSYTNGSGGSQTLREWGLKDADNDLLTRMVYADVILEDGDTLNGRQRLRWQND